MISNAVEVKMIETPEDAPFYGSDTTALKIKGCLVIGRGTVSGKPTIDLQMEDAEGRKFIAMISGETFEGISTIAKEKRLQGAN